MNIDLQLDALRNAYRDGNTPRQLLLSLRDKAAALNPDYHLFIHLLSVEELEPYLAALDGRDIDSLPLYGVPFAIKDNIAWLAERRPARLSLCAAALGDHRRATAGAGRGATGQDQP
jgi:Asp-tRNA(Asn)/Glu-tRNA(Gln) amidotransferase A subunit family amidase